MVSGEDNLAEKTADGTVASGRGKGLRLLVLLGLLLLVVALVRGVGNLSAASQPRPITVDGSSQAGSDRASLVEEGKKLYADQCASCHGGQGNRVQVAPLNSKGYVGDLGSRLEQVVTQGRGTMPAWGKERGGPLDSRQVKAVGEYIRSALAVEAGGPGPAATPSVVPPAAPAGSQQQPGPPAIRHSFPNQADRCLECHARGAQSPMPVNHAGRANSSCLLCHLQAATLGGTAGPQPKVAPPGTGKSQP